MEQNLLEKLISLI